LLPSLESEIARSVWVRCACSGGNIVLADATDPNGRTSAAVRQLAFLNAAFETAIDNPIDAAIVSAGKQEGLSTTGHAKIDEIPYDLLRKRLTIVLVEGDDAERHLIVTKGAFVNVLSMCTHVERDGAVCPLTDAIISEPCVLRSEGQTTRESGTGHSVGYLGDGINDAPVFARGQRRHLGRPGGGRRSRERRHHPLEARPRRAAHGSGGRAAHVRGYAQIHLDTTSANFGNTVSMAIAAPLLPFRRTYRLIQRALDHRTESSPTHR
jgi:hypothetical protein